MGAPGPSRIARFAYDGDDRRTAITTTNALGDQTTSFVIDGLNRIIETDAPLARVTTQNYLPGSARLSKRDRSCRDDRVLRLRQRGTSGKPDRNAGFGARARLPHHDPVVHLLGVRPEHRCDNLGAAGCGQRVDGDDEL